MKKGIILIVLLCSILIYDHVKADTYVEGVDTPWYQSDRMTRLPSRNAFDYITQTSASINSTMKLSWFYNASYFNTKNIRGGYWELPFYVEAQVIRRDDNTLYYGCSQWRQNSAGGWYCYDVEGHNDYEYHYLEPQLSVQVIAVYDVGYTDICNVDLLNNRIHCPVATYTNLNGIASIQVFTNVWYPNNITDTYTYYVGLGRKANKFQTDGSAIVENQNQNTQTIIDSNTTYNNTPSQDYGNQTNEMNNITNAEDTLMNNLDFNTTDLNITMNPNASTFIWNIVDSLRLMSTKIVLLMTSILSLGIIKLVLNR